jgi:hypothetical protein
LVGEGFGRRLRLRVGREQATQIRLEGRAPSLDQLDDRVPRRDADVPVCIRDQAELRRRQTGDIVRAEIVRIERCAERGLAVKVWCRG